MSNFIGPALPPHLLNRISPDSEDSDENDKEILKNSQKDVLSGPLLPHSIQEVSKDTVSSDCDRSHPHRKQIANSKLPEGRTDDIIGPSVQSQEENVNPRKKYESVIGPTLPPKLRSKLTNTLPKPSDSSDEESELIGPVLPSHLKNSSDEDNSQESPVNVCVVGPRLPPFLTSKAEKQSFSGVPENRSNASIIGPSLPSHLKSKLEEELPTVVEDVNIDDNPKPVIGPTLPPHLQLKDEAQDESKNCLDMYGPALPPGFRPKTVVIEEMKNDLSESDDEDMGPLPEGNVSGSRVQHQLELRARKLRESMAGGESSTRELPTQRENWMLELPEDRAPELGLRPRQFRVREGPEAGDRTVWTDTPADRERKKKAPKARSPDRGALERQAVQERNKAMQQLAEEHSSKRGTRSLMDLHEEKLAAKRKRAEEAGEVQERRPFSRETDLQVNRFDEAQKRSVLKKAQLLNNRFSSGQSKFL